MQTNQFGSPMMIAPFGSPLPTQNMFSQMPGMMNQMMGNMQQQAQLMQHQMNAMQQQMQHQMHAMQQSAQPDGLGISATSGCPGFSAVTSMNSGGHDGGAFSCQSSGMTVTAGPDGRRHTEQFASSSVGDQGRRVRETQQTYSNSRLGVEKISLERQMDDQARKTVKERSHFTDEDRHTDLYHGMEEHQAGDFDQRWHQEAAPYIPRHAQVVQSSGPQSTHLATSQYQGPTGSMVQMQTSSMLQ
eukprot:TRINITY_DN40832_c0_g1_i1.p1 TRINITY_DN40832_c0_g1~~TRINITY_DN40832_c0_g1_i1.p1  ORF type:complete len:267 (+),score=39.49 TRINITY_DN40832_c0_g1_i1:71-802(+)